MIASGTEIVCSLGWGDHLVGRSHECDFPPSVLGLPVCNSPRVAVEGSSADIDRRVVTTLGSEGSVYDVDAALLGKLEPDLIITQDQCEVCAVSLEDVETACSAMGSSPAIVALNPSSLEDVWSDVRVVARELGVEDEGRRLAARLAARVDRVSADVAVLAGRPTVACVEWIEPLMISGNWMPEVVERAGGEAVLSRSGEHSGYVGWQELVQADPDVIVVMPCGFDIERTRQEMPTLSARPEWSGLSAVNNQRVFLVDGNQYFNRSGPRMVESVEIMAEILFQPKLDFGHRGQGWLPAG